MIKVRNILVICLIIILTLGNFNFCKAATVTKDTLQEAFNAIIEDNKTQDSDSSDEKIESVLVGDEIIKITTTKGKEHDIHYQLTGNSKFWIEETITNGMTYDEYERTMENIYVPANGYGAVARIQGLEDSSLYSYPLIFFLNSQINNVNNYQYILFDGTESNAQELETNGKTIIKKSEFASHVIEYLKDTLSTESKMDDKTEGDTFEWIIERVDISADECKVISTLVVNQSGDFTKVKDEYEKQFNILVNSFLDSIKNEMSDGMEELTQNVIDQNKKDQSEDNNNNNNEQNNNTSITGANENKTEGTTQTANINKIPYAGKTINYVLQVLYLITATAIFTIALIVIKNKKK